MGDMATVEKAFLSGVEQADITFAFLFDDFGDEVFGPG